MQPTLDLDQFAKRKQEHITHALDPANEAHGGSGLARLDLQHEALPDLNFDDISIESQRFGQPVSQPFLVSSMTAGHHQAITINEELAKACEQTGWAMGVGSQRRELTDADAATEWQRIRLVAPNVTLYGNLGIAQLIQTPIAAIQKLIVNLNASAVIIHLNALQECMQPEGTPQFKGGLNALEALCKNLNLPVIVKETGCGFSRPTLQRLQDIGIAAVDISGFGGTHWGRIEGARARASEHPHLERAAHSFKNWGVSTVDALVAAKSINPHYETWASGGIRNGLDAAKVLALGASTVGFAKPMLEAALKGHLAVIELQKTIEHELKIACFCTGSKNIDALQGTVVWR